MGSSAMAKNIQGIVVITNTKSSGINNKADLIIHYATSLRDCNNYGNNEEKKKTVNRKLPVMIYDLANPKEAKVVKNIFRVAGKQLPCIIIADFSPDGKSVLNFYKTPNFVIYNVQNPRKDVEKLVRIAASNNGYNNFKCPPATFLIVKTEPEGAEILIDGQSRGFSGNLRISLEPEREYRLTIKKDGYMNMSSKIELNYGEERTIEQILEPSTGKLELNTEPETALIKIDNTDYMHSPLVEESIRSGFHSVIVKQEQFRPITKIVRVKGGKTTRKTVELHHYRAIVRVTGHSFYEKGTAYNPILNRDTPYEIDLKINERILAKEIEHILVKNKFIIAKDNKNADIIVNYEAWPRTKEDDSTMGKLVLVDAETGFVIVDSTKEILSNRFNINSEDCLAQAGDIFEKKIFAEVPLKIENHFMARAQREYSADLDVELDEGKRLPVNPDPGDMAIIRDAKKYLKSLADKDGTAMWKRCSRAYKQLMSCVVGEEKKCGEKEAVEFIEKKSDVFAKILGTGLASRLSVPVGRLPVLMLRIVGKSDANALIEIVSSRGKTEMMHFVLEDEQWKAAPVNPVIFEKYEDRGDTEAVSSDAKDYLMSLSSGNGEEMWDYISASYIRMKTDAIMVLRGVKENEALKMIKLGVEKTAETNANLLCSSLSVSKKDLPYIKVLITKKEGPNAIIGLISSRNKATILQMTKEGSQWKVIPLPASGDMSLYEQWTEENR
jgi:hypothetical protein